MIDEMVPLLRRLWAGETVTHSGEHYELVDASINPLPVQEPLELWFGGAVPSALSRVGRLGDGYIPGLSTPKKEPKKKWRSNTLLRVQPGSGPGALWRQSLL